MWSFALIIIFSLGNYVRYDTFSLQILLPFSYLMQSFICTMVYFDQLKRTKLWKQWCKHLTKSSITQKGSGCLPLSLLRKAMIPNSSYRFGIIPIKIPASNFVDIYTSGLYGRKKTQDSQHDTKGEQPCPKTDTTWLQDWLQSHSNWDSVILVKEQIHESVKQNGERRNRSPWTLPTEFWHRSKDNAMGPG